MSPRGAPRRQELPKAWAAGVPLSPCPGTPSNLGRELHVCLHGAQGSRKHPRGFSRVLGQACSADKGLGSRGVRHMEGALDLQRDAPRGC